MRPGRGCCACGRSPRARPPRCPAPRARSRRIVLRPELGVAEDGVGVHDVRPDAVGRRPRAPAPWRAAPRRPWTRSRPRSPCRATSRSWWPRRRSAPPSPWAMSTRIASRATRKWPVEFTAKERSQSASAIRSTGAECAMPALETTMSTPAVGQHGVLEGRPHRGLAGHVHRRAPSARPAARPRPRSRRRPCARPPRRGRSPPRARPRRPAAAPTARPMPLAAAGDQRDAPGQLLLGRRQRELVELERPVLDVEGVPRARATRSAPKAVGRADDRDRVVVDVV